MRHLSRGVLQRLTTMLDYAQTHIFDAVTTCGRYQGRLLLILILHSVINDITSTLPVGVNLPLGFNAKWPPHVNRRRAPGVLRLGFNGYDFLHETNNDLHNWMLPSNNNNIWHYLIIVKAKQWIIDETWRSIDHKSTMFICWPHINNCCFSACHSVYCLGDILSSLSWH